ncbi:methylated-DNA--[protein]-cysteine S-methyltransferase [Parachitinimonas caeni]|uniref:Methylated-DNA--protein-cysteine methyltransferase n=1 Tax=Parachitinimonas caeni TaxID=3031301 RepID=A0ABT7DXE7_9NEIS|nr:methylated-DNA--[protein]-cysteine S-methyltransferase [Parachitinimonas caeni]MDK2124741.1 methylated-DNA--[protein]-cysteine S-methyltransferase [Parachitinimonas caeni]
MWYARFYTRLGSMLALAGPDGLLGLYFADQKYLPSLADAVEMPSHPMLRQAQAQLNAWLAGDIETFDLPLAPQGTLLQQQVWQALQSIPAGQTWTYLQLARHVGRERAVRAVAQAVARNPLIIVVPCHRVIGTNGSLTGFAAGIERKRALLDREQPALAIAC